MPCGRRPENLGFRLLNVRQKGRQKVLKLYSSRVRLPDNRAWEACACACVGALALRGTPESRQALRPLLGWAPGDTGAGGDSSIGSCCDCVLGSVCGVERACTLSSICGQAVLTEFPRH